MEPLEALHRVLAVGHHLYVMIEAKEIFLKQLQVLTLLRLQLITRNCRDVNSLTELILPGSLQLLL